MSQASQQTLPSWTLLHQPTAEVAARIMSHWGNYLGMPEAVQLRLRDLHHDLEVAAKGAGLVSPINTRDLDLLAQRQLCCRPVPDDALLCERRARKREYIETALRWYRRFPQA